MLTAEQNSGVANHGVYIIGDEVPVRRKLDPAAMSDEQRKTAGLAALLRGEMKTFNQMRK